MSKQLVRAGFKQIKDLYLRIAASRNLFIEFVHEVRSATQLPVERTRKSLLTVSHLFYNLD